MKQFATRQKFVDLVVDQLGCLYIWNGKGEFLDDPESEIRTRVFDCSGLVTWCLYTLGGPDWRHTHRADTLYRSLPSIASPLPGDLAFYGPPNGPAVHVVVCMGNGGAIIGANGGTSGTTTPAKAERRKAFVKMDTRGPHYRTPDDLIGFRSLANFLSNTEAHS